MGRTISIGSQNGHSQSDDAWRIERPRIDDRPSFPECDHSYAGTKTEPRRRTYANGSEHIVLQCLVCGKEAKKIRTTETSLRAEAYQNPRFDEALAETVRAERTAAWDAWRERQKLRTADANAEWWRRYDAYLQSDQWWLKRNQRLELDHYLCQAKLCGCTRMADHVHHLTYDHLFNEPLFDLISVCRSCHDQITAMDRERRR